MDDLLVAFMIFVWNVKCHLKSRFKDTQQSFSKTFLAIPELIGVLRTQIPGSPLRSTKSYSLLMGLKFCTLSKSVREFFHTLKFDNHVFKNGVSSQVYDKKRR